MPAHLVIRDGPNGGEIHGLGSTQLLIGRGDECGLRLADHFASRQHVRIEPRGTGYWAIDLGGRNRMMINGLPQNERELQFGDVMTVGATRILFLGSTGNAPMPRADLAECLTRHLPENDRSFEIIGTNERILEIFGVIQKVAPIDVTVLVTGESGTGKELIASALHRASARAKKPLVCVNCAAIAKDLMESELFGHERGAFTGAHAQRLGKFELADGGTLLLDEIGELSPEGQAKLLRVLEERRVTRVGGERTVDVDVRVIAATNRDLHAMVAQDKFRRDLLYRLEVVTVHLPPLRERREDIPQLAHHFLHGIRERVGRRVESISSDAMQKLMLYDWPGNIRELKNVLERAVIMGSSEKIMPEDVLLTRSSSGSGAAPAMPGSNSAQPFPTLDELTKRHIEKALQLAAGNKKQAAEMLNIPRSSLYDHLARYGIN